MHASRSRIHAWFLKTARSGSISCRCDGMADVTDSKSVGLITRVGSSPTTGTSDPTIQKVQKGNVFHVEKRFFFCFTGQSGSCLEKYIML